ncbi:MAG: acyl-ACP--UDP-N-acetylglucosamine O-acyltransferase [Gemmatimonadota bacterium]|nr:acyl-[acyl-carrier-protein]--UDP-N-acetylglucosamine O-acyltransferase [Candidatus Woesearchaeota archaeon]MDP6528936.1 acyl-ACP--UDP-N-acetylglucosamine O-acyltransferase [Gemmatimonadota bacterium]MDP6803211.1 acyl-ACP--UDP-N-acetylglucosamine O-acyltransferase [Gemmatimonadota bacterium]MDP7032432.1 acyl-ACP--UDP-N-acetylglucosamine O-acyltransferase [Gemmatimonadota bacterium]
MDLSHAAAEPLIHPTAVVHPNAVLGENVRVGPYCVVGAGVVLGDDCLLDSHVRLDGHLLAGKRNHFFHCAAIAGEPQDLKFDGVESTVRIGDDNIFREFVTVNRATGEDGETRIGNGNLLMAYVHVAHDCILHDGVILANAVNLAGHVEVFDRAVIGGMTPVHQFVRIGKFAIVGGASRLPKDMPPYMKAAGNPIQMVGLNTIGLRRNGIDADTRSELKRAYRTIYRDGLNVTQAVRALRERKSDCPEIAELISFITSSVRGIVR